MSAVKEVIVFDFVDETQAPGMTAFMFSWNMPRTILISVQ